MSTSAGVDAKDAALITYGRELREPLGRVGIHKLRELQLSKDENAPWTSLVVVS